MYFFIFFPFHIQKSVGETQTQLFYYHQISAGIKFSPSWIDASHCWWVDREQTPLQSQKEKKQKITKGEPLALLNFHRTNSLFLLFNAERSMEVVAFHIRTSAGGVRLQSAGDIRNSGATRPPHSHRALHQDLEENDTTLTPVTRVSMSTGHSLVWQWTVINWGSDVHVAYFLSSTHAVHLSCNCHGN